MSKSPCAQWTYSQVRLSFIFTSTQYLSSQIKQRLLHCNFFISWSIFVCDHESEFILCGWFSDALPPPPLNCPAACLNTFDLLRFKDIYPQMYILTCGHLKAKV